MKFNKLISSSSKMSLNRLYFHRAGIRRRTRICAVETVVSRHRRDISSRSLICQLQFFNKEVCCYLHVANSRWLVSSPLRGREPAAVDFMQWWKGKLGLGELTLIFSVISNYIILHNIAQSLPFLPPKQVPEIHSGRLLGIPDREAWLRESSVTAHFAEVGHACGRQWWQFPRSPNRKAHTPRRLCCNSKHWSAVAEPTLVRRVTAARNKTGLLCFQKYQLFYTSNIGTKHAFLSFATTLIHYIISRFDILLTDH